ncbi:MAG: urease accessory protein UreH domain-containing protein [Planctomycetota bacterium]|jgi:sulfite exporter TauE/SafE
MNNNELMLLCWLALSTGVLHTLIGADHYVPFIAMSKARDWSITRTLSITLLCGIGHVLSSVVLGLIGIAAGVAISNIEGIEGTRGAWAAWLMIGFGVVYALWGLKRAISGKTHTHGHLHGDGDHHHHEHSHTGEHTHVHDVPAKKPITPWVLFVIFVFGPCEVLIPAVMYPAAKGSWWGVAMVTILFGAATIGTMLLTVAIGAFGLKQVRLGYLERYAHVMAGTMIAAGGLAIQLLGI